MTELPASFGKYFLTEKLATGGMAEIYLGKLVGPGGFEKSLVIKQIHPRLAAEPHFVDLFVAEAKTLVGLSHGNIVPVYELGIVEDTYFIAMEYIDGPTLYGFTEAVWRAGDAIEPDVAAYIAARILEGLDYAHRRGDGVIHRDLSPRNVMLSRDGEVKLVDFGIAVAFGAADDGAADGAPTGSFPYMSPEQVERKALTTASDLFSAGVLLWEMLAGQRLFARATAEATLDAVVHTPIQAPSAIRPGVPRRLDEVVLRALERDIARRWSSAGDALAALHRHLYSPEAEHVPTARRLAALIARYCPPIVESGDDDGAADVRTTAAAGAESPDAGPATVVVPRRTTDASAPDATDAPDATEAATDDNGDADAVDRTRVHPRGKRPGTMREHSFATHVELEAVMSGTPLFGVRAIRDEATRAAPASPPQATTVSGETQAKPPAARRAAAADATVAAAEAAATATTLAHRDPRRTWLLVALLAAAACAVGAWWLLRAPATASAPVDARAAVAAPDAAPPDGPPAPIDAAPTLDAAPLTDAAGAPRLPVDAGPVRVAVDAGIPIDAGPVRVTVDAGPIDAAAARAMGVIKVGANPWGQVAIDGKAVGNAPNQWPVPVGKHVVEVTHPGEAGAADARQTFHVDVEADEIESVFADFTP